MAREEKKSHTNNANLFSVGSHLSGYEDIPPGYLGYHRNFLHVINLQSQCN